MLLYCLVVCSTACFCIGTWFSRWLIAVAAATTNAVAAAAECTMRNRKTGDLSLIIRFTFYAFQMINANVFSPSFALVHAGTKKPDNKRMAQNLSCELFGYANGQACREHHSRNMYVYVCLHTDTYTVDVAI